MATFGTYRYRCGGKRQKKVEGEQAIRHNAIYGVDDQKTRAKRLNELNHKSRKRYSRHIELLNGRVQFKIHIQS